MSSPHSEGAPLARLVLFMVCLAIIGGVFAAAHYYVVDLPEQNSIQAPANECGSACTSGHKECRDKCHGDRACIGRCIKIAQQCTRDC